ncbi:MAG: spore germination protein, partial [Clostridium sp.]
MRLLRKKKKKELSFDYEHNTKTDIPKNIDDISKIFKDTFVDSHDMVFREFNIGSSMLKGFLCQIDGLSDKMLVDDFVMEPLTILSRQVDLDLANLKENLFKAIQNTTIAAADIKEVEYIE